MILRPIILGISFITFLIVTFLNICVADGALTKFEQKRAELLTKMINQQMVKHHYLHRSFDDELSQKIFNSYIKQLDPGKRFFLKGDIELLSGYSLRLDNEIQAGSLAFPLLAEERLSQGVKRAQEILEDIAISDINFHQDTVLQTDTNKLGYCQTEQELRERWHKVISYESILDYLDLMEFKELDRHVSARETKTAGKDIADIVNKNSEQIRKMATERVIHNNRLRLQEVINQNTMARINRYLAIIIETSDPNSTYMPPRKHDDFNIDLRGSFEGIGANLEKVDGEIKVVKILDGGAAARQKQLQISDSILKVGQEDAVPIEVRGKKLRDVIDLIRGKKGTEVRLTVKKSDGSIQVIPITRDIVQLKDKFVQTAPLHDSSNDKFYGYMKIPSFYRNFEKTHNGINARNVSDDVLKGLEDLKAYGIQGLVLDLRNNPGGANVDATYVGGLFFQYGPIQQTKNSNGKIKPSYDFDPATIYKGPMVVLVNEHSASSTEVLVGALQDLKRALIVGGAHTYGKGAAQELIDLDLISSLDGIDLSPYKPLGLLKITTQAVFRINGESIQQHGITPDIILPTPKILSTTIESHLENALQFDSIAPINTDNLLKQLDLPVINLEALRQASRKRVSADTYFQKLIKIEKEAEQHQRQTEVVLNVDKIEEQRRSLRENNRRMKTLWEYDHAEHGWQSSVLPEHGLQGENAEVFHAKQLESDPYIKESLSLLKDMEQ